MLKSVTGIFYLASDPYCLKALVELMKLPDKIEGLKWSRRAMFEVLEEILAPLMDSNQTNSVRGPNLVVNYAALILMAFIKNGLIEVWEGEISLLLCISALRWHIDLGRSGTST